MAAVGHHFLIQYYAKRHNACLVDGKATYLNEHTVRRSLPASEVARTQDSALKSNIPFFIVTRDR